MAETENQNEADASQSELSAELEFRLLAAKARVTFWRRYRSTIRYTLPTVSHKTKEASRNRKRRLVRHAAEAEKRFLSALHRWAEQYPGLRANEQS